jgi:hypothetical protein
MVVISHQYLMKLLQLKHDKYRKARGGYSRLLEIHCEHCSHVIALYQKDGPGSLKRLLGIPYIYEKEKRPAFRLFQGSVTKKSKGDLIRKRPRH